MCGIAGIVGRDADLSRPSLERMRVALRHRGPDDTGSWISPANRMVSFAHTRLAVIDTTPAGHQPMSTPDGRLTISFNGEVYNFRALRDELEQRGVTFRTNTDTEVILHAYDAFGVECLPRLRGMFAFALWDERERTCLLARDVFGLKPLYFHHAANGSLIFASEVRALQASKLVPTSVNAQAVYGYLRTGSVAEPDTLLNDVQALEAGHYALWRGGVIRSRRYWALQFPHEPADTGDAVESMREALRDSVRHHFVSDVPVGLFLSGGVDSAVVLALARANGQEAIQTFSMTLPGNEMDEGPLARRTAEHFSARHTPCEVDAATARDLFPRYLAAADQPSIDGFNTFVVSKCVHEHGLKVALSGVGADELFGGYASFGRVPRIAEWNHQLSWTGPVRTMSGWMLERFAPRPRWRRVGDLLQQAPSLANTYETFRGVYTRSEARKLVASYGLSSPGDEPEAEPAMSATDADEVSRLELTRYVRNQLLRESDVASMAWGVELRAPFLDVRLFEAAAKIPATLRLGPSKRLLRDSVPELPAWVDETKRCFQFPFDDWMKREWRPVFADIEARSPVPMQTWYRKWCVFMLDHWLARMADGS
jgi:asparagine synthase (glutamine-hydrolysing)